MSAEATERGEQAAVSPAAGELAAEVLRLLRSTFGPCVLETEAGPPALYAVRGQVGLFERRCRNPVLVAATCRAGAKSRIAETMGRRDAEGVDLVAGCVNQVLERGALPLFFLASAAVAEDGSAAVEVLKGISAGCRQADCALLASDAATLPDAVAPGACDLAGFAVGMVERARLLDGRERTRPGDVILGIQSSGLHASGFAPARRVLLDGGRLRLDEEVPELKCSLGEELLRPERIYERAVRAVLERYRVKEVVHGIARVAGGGLVGDIGRLLGRRCVAKLQRAALPRKPIFELVQRLGAVGDEEMFRTFNMGVGLVVTVAPFYADAALRRIRRARERGAVIGEVVEGSGPAVELV